MTCARGSEAGRGYTLAELLTVIGVLAVLGGMSLGVFVAMPGRLAHEAAASTVRALLRRARAAAIESRADAQVTFDHGRVEARAWTSLALLRFEDVDKEARGFPVPTQGSRNLAAR
ncbi:MAG TPA: prepilin-type N-terminal cleavage/methylation domain-containing protein, partial [Planctomycetota bacterium]|nr:prepilin-type N-terminal cleavage/methylation domain-containing protein [Planctomycetota bacterium]